MFLKIAVLSLAVFYVFLLLVPGFLYVRPAPPPDPFTSIFNTFLMASAATAVALPTALLLSFYAVKRGLGAIVPAITFSTAIPHTAVGLLLLPLFARLGLVDTAPAVVISMVVVSLPVGVGTLSSVFSNFNRSLDEFLQPLGIGDLQIAWLHVKGAVRAVIISAILVWLRCFSELGALLIVANRPVTVGIYVFELFSSGGAAASIPYAMLVALIGFIFSTVLYIISRRAELI